MASPRRLRPRVFWTLDPTLLARLAERARRRGVKVTRVVEEALLAALDRSCEADEEGERAA